MKNPAGHCHPTGFPRVPAVMVVLPFTAG